MTLSYRPKSPILKKPISLRAQEMITEQGKIHRILLKSQAICQLAHIESPNCIWFKMLYHITSDLQLNKPALLEPLEKFPDQYDYVMAPLEEGVYARARVIHVQTFEGEHYFCYVHFIDEGFGAWMLANCLSKMDPKLQWHPWQAFPVSLFKIDGLKIYDFDNSEGNGANLIQAELHKIMAEFEHFKLIPVVDKMRNDYTDYTRANIYGLTLESDDNSLTLDLESDDEKHTGKAESIAHRLALELAPMEILDRRMFSKANQPICLPEDMPQLEPEDAQRIYDEMPMWRRNFPTDFCVTNRGTVLTRTSNGFSEEWQNEPKPCQQRVASIDLNWLKANCAGQPPKYHKNGRIPVGFITLCLDFNSLKSPDELYGYPLENMEDGAAIENPLKHLIKQQTEWAEKLNIFYGNQANQRQLDPLQVVEQLKRGTHHPYAICQTNDGLYGWGGGFQRVQVLAIKNPLALGEEMKNGIVRVRYLDIGGNEIVPISGLLQIHSSHCQQRPLCIQLCLDQISPPFSASNWMLDEVRTFKSLIRFDVPAWCQLRLLNAEHKKTNFDALPKDWPAVFGAVNLYIGEAGHCLEQQMLAQGKAKQSIGLANIPTTQNSNLQNGIH